MIINKKRRMSSKEQRGRGEEGRGEERRENKCPFLSFSLFSSLLFS
jgi:hypothetical protein